MAAILGLQEPGIAILRIITGVRAMLLAMAVVGANSACAQEKTLSWSDTSSNESGFRIYRVEGPGARAIAEVEANVTRFTDKNPPPGACYYVTAFNDAGESAPTAVSCASR